MKGKKAAQKNELRIKVQYLKDAVPAMMKEFKYKNVMQVPKLEKITVNMGLGDAVNDLKIIDAAVKDMAAITGQKPRDAREEIHRDVQAPRRSSDRVHGYAPRREDVRILRPLRELRDAEDTRLQGRER